MAGVFQGWSFSLCAKGFGIVTVVSGILAGAILLMRKSFFRQPQRKRKKVKAAMEPSIVYQMLMALAGILILIQSIIILTDAGVYIAGDITLETVNSFLATDKIYQVNPLTGTAIATDMPLRIKILGLPTLYGSICYLFGLDAWQVIWHLVPVYVLVCGYLVYFQLGCILFPQSKERQACFLLLVILLMWAGDYLYGMDGFNILHSGFRGVTIRGMVLIPYTLSLLLRKRWGLVILCLAAESCVVWTLYGMGVCLAITAGMWLAGIVIRRKGEIL